MKSQITAPARRSFPDAKIWELVCHFPDAVARNKLLAMIRLYVDDSGKEGDSPVLVLAGYTSTAEKWSEFSNEWQSIIDDAGVAEFKMNDAWRLARPYRLIGPLRRDNIIVRCVECIKKHALSALATSIRFDDFHKYIDPIGDRSHSMGRAYYFSFFLMLTHVWRICETKKSLDVEVIFDVQGGESEKYIMESFYKFREVSNLYGPDVIVNQPIFRASKTTLPLQASDMLAWLIRRDATNLYRGKDRSKCIENVILGEALSMPHAITIPTLNQMQEYQKHFLKYFESNSLPL